MILADPISDIIRNEDSPDDPDAERQAELRFRVLSALANGCVGAGCVPAQETYTYNNRLQPWMMASGRTLSLTTP